MEFRGAIFRAEKHFLYARLITTRHGVRYYSACVANGDVLANGCINRFRARSEIAYCLRSATTTDPPFCFTPVSQLLLVSYYKLEDVNGRNSLIECLAILLYDWINSKQPMKNRVVTI